MMKHNGFRMLKSVKVPQCKRSPNWLISYCNLYKELLLCSSLRGPPTRWVQMVHAKGTNPGNYGHQHFHRFPVTLFIHFNTRLASNCRCGRRETWGKDDHDGFMSSTQGDFDRPCRVGRTGTK